MKNAKIKQGRKKIKGDLDLTFGRQQNLEQMGNDITVTKFLDSSSNDTSVTKFLNAPNDTSVTKFLDTAQNDVTVTKFLS